MVKAQEDVPESGFTFTNGNESADTASELGDKKRDSKYFQVFVRRGRKEIASLCALLGLPQKIELTAQEILLRAEEQKVNFNKR